MKVKYIVGDATTPIASGHKAIVHCCNDIGAWGAGFVMALSKKWPQPEAAYQAWHRRIEGNFLPLGEVQPVFVEDDTVVFNLIGQHQTGSSGLFNKPPIRYNAIQAGLAKMRAHVKVLPNCSVHLPRMGAGLAGGDWDTIASLIQKELCAYDIPVTVYDLEPQVTLPQENLL
jgi:O-acetyl-ADP-ribose deacetylase (regulator of RNase III)